MHSTGTTLAVLLAQARPVFRRWERLRIPYNTLLTVLVILPTAGDFHGTELGDLLILLMGAALANLCFLAGPMAESYLAWLGVRSKLVTAVLFVGGVLISIPCVYFLGFGVVLMNS